MKIVVLAGGISTERDVSLMSGSKVYYALKSRGHQAIMLDVFLGYEGDTKGIFEKEVDWAEMVAPISEEEPDIEEIKARRKDKSDILFGPNVLEICKAADIVFFALHGGCGEDGKIQGTFDLYGIKYTGTDPLSSAICMSKPLTKQILIANGIKTPEYYMLSGKDDKREPKFPCVVKVSSGGSSIGVYIAHNRKEYDEAINGAYEYEAQVMVEEFVEGREFTDCVMEGVPLPAVEIVPKQGFYDYKNKYQAGSTDEYCPARIDEASTKRLQEIARKAYNALGIKTYARIDFMMDKKGDFYCIEANTLPGMTPTSLVPQEAAAIGKSFEDLCEWIIEVSLRKYQ